MASLLSGWLFGFHLSAGGWIALAMTSVMQTLFAVSWVLLGIQRSQETLGRDVDYILFLAGATVFPFMLTAGSLDTTSELLGYLSPDLMEYSQWSIWLNVLAWPTLSIEAFRQGNWIPAVVMLSSVIYMTWRGVQSFSSMVNERVTFSCEEICIPLLSILSDSADGINTATLGGTRSEMHGEECTESPSLIRPTLASPIQKVSTEEDVVNRIDALCRQPKNAWERSYHSLVRPAVWMEALIRDFMPIDIIKTGGKHLALDVRDFFFGGSKLSWKQRSSMLLVLVIFGVIFAFFATNWILIGFYPEDEGNGIALLALSGIAVMAMAGLASAPSTRWQLRGGALYPVSQKQNLFETSKLWLRNACLLSPIVIGLFTAAIWRYTDSIAPWSLLLIPAAFAGVGIVEIGIVTLASLPLKRNEISLFGLCVHATSICTGGTAVLSSLFMADSVFGVFFDSENHYLLTLLGMRVIGGAILFAHGYYIVSQAFKNRGDILLSRPKVK